MNLILFPNSSTTSLALVGLSLDAMLALGAASGASKILSKFLATLCLGILIATVFFLAVAILEIFDLAFLFKIKVIGIYFEKFGELPLSFIVAFIIGILISIIMPNKSINKGVVS